MDAPVTEIALIVSIAVGASWAAARIRIPSIVLLLTSGVVIGAGLQLVDPDALAGDLLNPFVSISVGMILFEGGLSLRIREIRGSQRVVWLLVTVGVVVTWLLGAWASSVFLDVSMSMALLLGAILVVSGPTVIGPILTTVRPSRTVSSVLKWESIVIDPIGAMLAVIVAEFILVSSPDSAEILTEAGGFIVAGIVSGLVVSVPATVAIKRHLIPERLIPLVGLAAALVAFAIADAIAKEAGLLATTVLGLALANNRQLRTEPLIEFSEVVKTLLVGVLFVLLSARLTRDDIALLSAGVVGLILVLGLIARPLAVALSTWRSQLSVRERVFVAGVAPRGIVAAAVASVFAFDLAEAGIEGAEILPPVTFAVIVATVLIYGFGAGPLARRLGLAEKSSQGVIIVGAGPVEREIGSALHGSGIDVLFASTNRSDEASARMQGYRTFYGNLIDHEIPPNLDLAGIGRMLAVTPNDEVNTLAVRRFRELFGAAETYQLVAEPHGPGIASTAADLGGRKLFGGDLTYPEFHRRLRAGLRIRRSTLRERFTANQLKEQLDEGSRVLFLVRGGQLAIEVADGSASVLERAVPGDTVLWLPGSAPGPEVPGRRGERPVKAAAGESMRPEPVRD